jgi:hypothetical protein
LHANGNEKTAKVVTVISDKIDTKSKTMKRDKESHHIVTERSILPKDNKDVCLYLGTPKYIKQILTDLQ